MPRIALLAAAPLAAAAFVLVVTGVVELPDLEHALTELSETLGRWTYLLVGGLAFLETGAFVGLVAPGETAIVLGGVVAAQGQIDLLTVLLVAWVAAALGDIASFVLGARLGRRFLLRHGPRVGVTGPRLDRVEAFYERHGAKAILVGRFVGIVRAVSPFLAGSSGLPFRALPALEHPRHGDLGERLHARRLRLQRVLQRGRGHADARRLRARADRRDRCSPYAPTDARRYCTLIRSTTKTSVSFGPITPPAPRAP